MSRTSKTVAAILSAVVVFLAAFLWPTMYRYDKVQEGDDLFPIRINRVTGTTESFRRGKWIGQPRQLPSSELALITGRGSVLPPRSSLFARPHYEFAGSLTNGSRWGLTEIVFEVTVANSQGGHSEHLLAYRWEDAFQPLTSDQFSIEIPGLSSTPKFTWKLAEAKGYPPGRIP